MLDGGEMHGGEAKTHGGALRRVGEGPGHVDGAMEDGTHWGELGVGHGASPYVGVGRGHAMGGVRAQGKRVGSGGPSEHGDTWVCGNGA